MTVKKVKLIIVVYFISIFLFIGMILTGDSYSKKLKGTDFAVGWVNLPICTTVTYTYPDTGGTLGILPNRITDVFWNTKYILAKQCEAYTDSLLAYYIVEILPPERIKCVPYEVTGPLSEIEFAKKVQELGLDLSEMDHINIFKSPLFDW